ncbi:MAG: molybdopterin molybdotransferase MoeA [Candidatus Rokubacteria bacterium]|nr:molybdopterin molybdotransferase MoeA [Candidatus Rokubacteria bacterium]
MISVAEGQSRILAEIVPLREIEPLPVARSLGRTLAEDVLAPFDIPPADNSAVDGYAVNHDDIPKEGKARLRVIADLPAGWVFDGVIERGETVRIMTGAPLPKGVDTVVHQEITEREGDMVWIQTIGAGANVRLRGEDVMEGQRVLTAGAQLRPQEMGLLASLGFPAVKVFRRPRVAILSTGDEVTDPGQSRRPGQIYDANRFSLVGLVREVGCEALDFGIVPDVREELRSRLLAASEKADVVLTSGGVSVGVFDLVKEVLAEIGGIDFWQVNMTPGRPLARGRVGKAHFFGLPGNPVASMVTFLLFVRPALWKLMGRRELEPRRFEAVATATIGKKPGRREFKRGILTFNGRRWEVSTTGPQGSGILTSMVAGNCLIILPEERGPVQSGELVLVEPFQQP